MDSTNLNMLIHELQRAKNEYMPELDDFLVWKLARDERQLYEAVVLDSYFETLTIGVDRIPRKGEIQHYADNRSGLEEAALEVTPELRDDAALGIIYQVTDVVLHNKTEIIAFWQCILLRMKEVHIDPRELDNFMKTV